MRDGKVGGLKGAPFYVDSVKVTFFTQPGLRCKYDDMLEFSASHGIGESEADDYIYSLARGPFNSCVAY